MRYVQYGNTDMAVSRFGLGCMRFPADEKEAVEMIRYAIDHGVNYLDTAYVYGNSETILGKALKDGYRDKVCLATKSPTWNITEYGDFEKYLDEELKRLGTDCLDVYLLHNLYSAHWEKIKKYDGLKFLDRMAEKGKLRYKGFSIHSSTKALKEIVDSFDWTMCLIQMNILDERRQVGMAGLKYAASKGLAVCIMEPLRGGHILRGAPKGVYELIEAYPEKRSLAEWCFRWLYDMPEVTTVLSGTSSLAQLKDNLRIFENAEPGVMSKDEKELIANIRGVFEANKSVGCTGCGYCLPCPFNVGIPDIFSLYNSYLRRSAPVRDKKAYRKLCASEGRGADRCEACGACAKRCPQELDIPYLLEQAHGEMME